jgi:hypothetical protein
LWRTSDNWPIDKDYVTDLGYAVVRCLRLSTTLPTTSAGFAYITDVTWVLWQDTKTYRGISRRPTVAEVMFAVEASDEGRFQVTVLRPQISPCNAVIRAIQGWSGPIAERIMGVDAFEAVGEVGVMIHYSQQHYLPTIIGAAGRGPTLVGSQVVAARTFMCRRNRQPRMARFLTSSRSEEPMSCCTWTQNPCSATSSWGCRRRE